MRRELSVRHADEAFFESGIAFVDSTFLDIFSYPMIEGDPVTALARPNTVVITESIARKYFGSDGPWAKN